jgi:hypothetical protein
VLLEPQRSLTTSALRFGTIAAVFDGELHHCER